METAQLLPAFLDDSGLESIEPTPLAQKAKASLALTRTPLRSVPDSTMRGRTPVTSATPDSPEVDRFLLRVRNARPTDTPTLVTAGPARHIDPPSYGNGSATSGWATKLPGMSLPDEVGTGEPIPGARILAGPNQLAPSDAGSPQAAPSAGMLMPLLVLFIIIASVVLMLELAGLWP